MGFWDSYFLARIAVNTQLPRRPRENAHAIRAICMFLGVVLFITSNVIPAAFFFLVAGFAWFYISLPAMVIQQTRTISTITRGFVTVIHLCFVIGCIVVVAYIWRNK